MHRVLGTMAAALLVRGGEKRRIRLTMSHAAMW